MRGLTRPEVRQLFSAFLLQFFVRSATSNRAALERALAPLPSPVRDLLAIDEAQVRAWAGMFSDPNCSPHPLMHALEESSARTLRNLRDWVRSWNKFWSARIECARVALRTDPGILI